MLERKLADVSLLGHATQTTGVDLANGSRLDVFAYRLEVAHMAFLWLAANLASVDLVHGLIHLIFGLILLLQRLAHMAFLGLAANAASINLALIHLPMLCSRILLMRRLEHGVMNRLVCSNLAYALSRLWILVKILVLLVAENSACESHATFVISRLISMVE